MDARVLRGGRRCRLHVYDVAARTGTVVAEFTDVLYEAPNWSVDGRTLYLNGHGELWAFPLDSPQEPRRIEFAGLPALNNDHVLDPDGATVYMSAADGHIHHGALTGGRVRRVTGEDGVQHYLHGISPDGRTLAFVRIDGGPGRLALVPAAGGAVTVVDTGAGHVDGPEWSPDGAWIHLNTERWATRPGHAQLARLAGDRIERLVESDTVDWFPHLSPDGRLAVYLQYPSGTVGHPADLDVALVVVATTDWTTPLARVPVFGGQGTINVNSWSPDSTRFAFVSYPVHPVGLKPAD